MSENELRNQELARHEEKVDRNIEHNQAINLNEKKQGIATAKQNSAVARIIHIVYFLFGALELLLAIRIILYLIGANPDNGFASFIDSLSNPFVKLFASLLENPTVGATGVLEITTIIALFAYAILAWLVAQLLWLTLSRSR